MSLHQGWLTLILESYCSACVLASRALPAVHQQKLFGKTQEGSGFQGPGDDHS